MSVCPVHEWMQTVTETNWAHHLCDEPLPPSTPTSLKAPRRPAQQGRRTKCQHCNCKTAVCSTDNPGTCHGRNRQTATMSRNCTNRSARSVALAYHDLFPSSRNKLNHLHIFHVLWYGTPRKAPRKGSGDAKPLNPGPNNQQHNALP